MQFSVTKLPGCTLKNGKIAEIIFKMQEDILAHTPWHLKMDMSNDHKIIQLFCFKTLTKDC